MRSIVTGRLILEKLEEAKLFSYFNEEMYQSFQLPRNSFTFYNDVKSIWLTTN